MIRATKEIKGIKDFRELLVLVRKGFKAIKAFRVYKERKAFRGFKATKDFRDRREIKDFKVLPQDTLHGIFLEAGW